MKVAALIKDIKVLSISGNTDVDVQALAIDSRKAAKGSLFFAQKGTQVDGHTYIQQVIAAGAVAIICEQLPENIVDDVCYIVVENTAAVIGIVAATFYLHPSKNMRVIGVTLSLIHI